MFPGACAECRSGVESLRRTVGFDFKAHGTAVGGSEEQVGVFAVAEVEDALP